MLAIAGQTAEPNWLKKLEGTHWFPGGIIGYKSLIFFPFTFFKIQFFFIRFFPRATPGTSASIQ